MLKKIIYGTLSLGLLLDFIYFIYLKNIAIDYHPMKIVYWTAFIIGLIFIVLFVIELIRNKKN
mgnify:FL=1